MDRPQVKEPRFEVRVRYKLPLATGLASLILVLTIFLSKNSIWFALALGLYIFILLSEILLSFWPLVWKITYSKDFIRFRTMTGWKELQSDSVLTLVSFRDRSIKLTEGGGRSYYFGDLNDSTLHFLELARFCRENDLSFKMEGELPEHSGWKINTHLTAALNWNWKGTIGFKKEERLISEDSVQELSIKDDILILRREGMEVIRAPLTKCDIIQTSKGAITAGDSRLLVEVKGQGRWPLVDWNSRDYAEVVYVLTDRGVPIREDSGEPLGPSLAAKSRAVPEA
jgi:hypothetical protein